MQPVPSAGKPLLVLVPMFMLIAGKLCRWCEAGESVWIEVKCSLFFNLGPVVQSKVKLTQG